MAMRIRVTDTRTDSTPNRTAGLCCEPHLGVRQCAAEDAGAEATGDEAPAAIGVS